ncbi:MAG: hypothetical protein OEZ01_10610 [Candidatus Heimdallarchaeota archaeon]|nr:hypothetical protein [Candidatus Heimdallarchaeota archaeon]
MNLKLLEPLRSLFKDQVRKVGINMGIPFELINRHPFPGPGLAIRIIGKITKEKVGILQRIDHIFIEELKKNGIYDNIWQAFAVLLPIKSVGIVGDGRSYGYICSLRAITSNDGMTADFFPMDTEFMSMFWNVLSTASRKIVNEVSEISRVVYDITSKPPATIEWE